MSSGLDGVKTHPAPPRWVTTSLSDQLLFRENKNCTDATHRGQNVRFTTLAPASAVKVPYPRHRSGSHVSADTSDAGAHRRCHSGAVGVSLLRGRLRPVGLPQKWQSDSDRRRSP